MGVVIKDWAKTPIVSFQVALHSPLMADIVQHILQVQIGNTFFKFKIMKNWHSTKALKIGLIHLIYSEIWGNMIYAFGISFSMQGVFLWAGVNVNKDKL